MEQLTPYNRQTTLEKSSNSGLIIKEINPDDVKEEIALKLSRLVKLYQIQNIDDLSIVLLSEWVMDTYKFDALKTVLKCLQNPPQIKDKVWRLTPDTISEWMAITLEQEAEARERELSKEKTKTVEFKINDDISEETKKMIQDYLDLLSGPKMVQAMTDEDVKRYGKDRPVKNHIPYNSTPKEELIMKELRRRYYIECYDKITGKPLDNWMSFDEWVKL